MKRSVRLPEADALSQCHAGLALGKLSAIGQLRLSDTEQEEAVEDVFNELTRRASASEMRSPDGG